MQSVEFSSLQQGKIANSHRSPEDIFERKFQCLGRRKQQRVLIN